MVKLKPVCIFIIDLWTWIVYHWIFMYISFTKLLFYFVFIFSFYFSASIRNTSEQVNARWTRSGSRARLQSNTYKYTVIIIICDHWTPFTTLDVCFQYTFSHTVRVSIPVLIPTAQIHTHFIRHPCLYVAATMANGAHIRGAAPSSVCTVKMVKNLFCITFISR